MSGWHFPPSEDLMKFKHTESSLFINSLFTACARFKISFKPSQFLVQHIVQLFKILEFPTKRISQKKKRTSVIYKIKYIPFADASKNMGHYELQFLNSYLCELAFLYQFTFISVASSLG